MTSSQKTDGTRRRCPFARKSQSRAATAREAGSSHESETPMEASMTTGADPLSVVT
jgi:hypothetical protein